MRTAVLWSGHLHTEGRCAECIVLDLCANGAKVRVGNDVTVDGRRYALEVPRLGALSCEIAWRRGGQIGLRFGDEIATIAMRMSDVLPQSRAIAG